jgi:hypothetical protein
MVFEKLRDLEIVREQVEPSQVDLGAESALVRTDAKRLRLRWRRLRVQAGPYRPVHDLLERLAFAPGLFLEPAGEVVVEGQRRSHGVIGMTPLVDVKTLRLSAKGLSPEGQSRDFMPT